MIRIISVNRLRCEHSCNPAGIDTCSPGLSWKVHSLRRGCVQNGYHIQVASSCNLLYEESPDLWDTEWVNGSAPTIIKYEGKELQSRQQCHWRVRILDEHGHISAWSKPAFWEMGLLKQSDWEGRWIGMDKNIRKRSAPILRKQFAVDHPPVKARLYICGLGYFEANLNGSRIGEDLLNPAQTDYDKRCLYSVYDVTGMIKTGSNALSCILGDGWYNQNMVWNDGKGFVYGEPKLLAQLEIEFTNGTRQIIKSSTEWKAAQSSILFNNIYAGEYCDARKDPEGWELETFDDSSWDNAVEMPVPGGRLKAQTIPPIRKCRNIAISDYRKMNDSSYIFDFGENFSGWIKLNLNNTVKRQKICIKFAETINADGELDPQSTGVYHTKVVQTDTYICKGAKQENWEPRFTYHGFRYARISGIEHITDNTIEAFEVRSSLDITGSFSCSNDTLNTLHDMALRTHLANVHSVPEDCPARERCGWLADAMLVCEYSMYNTDSASFWRKYLEDISTTRNGGVPYDIAPGKRQGSPGVPDWVAAQIIIPWTAYLHTGDLRFITDNWEGMVTVIDLFIDKAENFILSQGRGDWFDVGGNSATPTNTPEKLTTTAWFYRSANVMASCAKLLGKQPLAEKYSTLSANIKNSFNGLFFNNAKSSYMSQTANAMAIAFELAENEQMKQAANALVNDLQNNDYHTTSGIMGIRYIGDALSLSGNGGYVTKMLCRKGYPGFVDIIDRGATTLWEYWGEKEIDKALGARSLCHPMFGGYDTWFFEHLAGIKYDEASPGFMTVNMTPDFNCGLEWVKASVEIPSGTITSKWQHKNNTINWDIEIPVNSRAVINLKINKNTLILESGFPVTRAPFVDVLEMADTYIKLMIYSGEYSFSLQNVHVEKAQADSIYHTVCTNYKTKQHTAAF